MRRLANLVLIALLATGLGGAGQPAPKRLIEFSETGRADLDRVSAYLNSIRTLRGDFVQIGPDGQIDQGRFYLEKPGRMRFEYRPPNPILIVADGRTVAVANSKLKTVDRYPLSATPLSLILADKIDLRRNSAILAVRHEAGALIIEARTSTNRNRANLTLVFADPELELRQWTIVDDQGLTTTVALRTLEQGVAVDARMFVLKDFKAPVGVKARD
ncbi:MAG TPA: outer-membrane lipoprotein carrier protein LolA [Rhizomicrobium sp.]